MDPFNNRRASRGRYLGRGRPLSRGGYRFVDSGAGVWTPGMRAEEAARRNAAQKAAADAAYADMEARIVAINSNGALTQRQKVNTLSQLRHHRRPQPSR